MGPGARMGATSCLVLAAAGCDDAGGGADAGGDAAVSRDVARDLGAAPTDTGGVTGDGGAVIPRDAPDDRGAAPTPDVPRRAFTGGFVEEPLTPPGPMRYEVLRGFDFGEPESTAGVVTDLDGDGRAELLDIPEFLRVGPSTRRAAVFHRADGGGWRHDPALSARLGWRVFAAADLDGDGRTDLIGDDFGFSVAWGVAGGVAEPTHLEPQVMGGGFLRIASLFVDDLDGDGWLDVIVARSACAASEGPLQVWMSLGGRRFVRRLGMLPGAPHVKPYAVGVARPRPGEVVIASFGGACSQDERAQVFFHPTGVDAEGYPRFVGFNPIPADPDFQPGSRDPDLARYVPMAASWDDLDADGRFDLLVTLDPVHSLFGGADAWPLREGTNDSGFSRLTGDETRPLLPWSALALDLDRDGLREVIFTHGNDLGGWQGPRFSPTQWTTVHQNRGSLRFDEVPGALGLAVRGQWRALTAADPDGDGDADLILGGNGEHPRAFRNEVGPPGRGVALRLVGTASNPLGAGATVEVPAHEDVAAQWALAGGTTIPVVATEPLVFLSAGPGGRLPLVRVTWPSGLRQTLRDVPAGRLTRVVEPELITIAPASRRQPAGAGSSFILHVTPRREDGTLDAEAPVEVALLRGAAREAVASRRVSEGWIATIPAADAPGTARVEIRVRGEALGVLPRVWWE